MKHNELLKELEKRMSRYGYCDTWTHIEFFIKEYEALTKDEKPIRLKAVIKRIKEFDNGTKLKWTYDILKELGSDFASKMFHEGYQQGRFDEAVETNHEPKKVKVPQFVADFISEQKKLGHTLSYSIDACMSDRVAEWYWDNSELFARAWLDGYEVEKEKRYVVNLKNGQPLTKTKSGKAIYFNQDIITGNYKFTRKQLEEAGFGWVFDCEGVEVEEVEE